MGKFVAAISYYCVQDRQISYVSQLHPSIVYRTQYFHGQHCTCLWHLSVVERTKYFHGQQCTYLCHLFIVERNQYLHGQHCTCVCHSQTFLLCSKQSSSPWTVLHMYHSYTSLLCIKQGTFMNSTAQRLQAKKVHSVRKVSHRQSESR